MNFFELMNGNAYLDIYEHLIPTKVKETIIAAEDMLKSSDEEISKIAKKFANDSALKENIRHCVYLTIDRLKGIRNNTWGNDQRNQMQEIVDFKKDEFIFWIDTLQSGLSSYPIWDKESFEQLVYNYLHEEDEYVNIAEVLSIYFTCSDNDLCRNWFKFLYQGMLCIEEKKCNENPYVTMSYCMENVM